MERERAFSLVDCALAMAIVFFGISAVWKLSGRNKQHLFLARERHTAQEILSHLKTLPRAYLESGGDRFYDVRGLPTGDEGKFRVHVVIDAGVGAVTYRCEVSWQDGEGRPRTLTFYRLEWRQYEGI